MPDRVEALADRQAAAQGALTARMVAALVQLWAAFTAYYDDAEVAAFAERTARLVSLAQIATARLTEQYLRQVLTAMGEPPTAGRIVTLPGSLRGGVALPEVYQRPARTVRYLQSVDGPDPVAQGGMRLQVMGQTDVQLAQRESARQVLAAVENVRGYRRIIHPELSRGGVCGLCIAASDRVYNRGALLPIHDRCHCTVLPIIGAQDPGQALNASDLSKLYKAAGSTAAADLKKVRYQVQAHGELGPVLRVAGQDFRGPEDVPAAA